MPDWREVDTIADAAGRTVTVGVRDGKVTLRTLHTRTAGAVELDEELTDRFASALNVACWQAARESASMAVT